MKTPIIFIVSFLFVLKGFSQDVAIIWTSIEKPKKSQPAAKPKKLTWGNEILKLAETREQCAVSKPVQPEKAVVINGLPGVIPHPNKSFENDSILVRGHSFVIQDILEEQSWAKIISSETAELFWCDEVKSAKIGNIIYIPILSDRKKYLAMVEIPQGFAWLKK